MPISRRHFLHAATVSPLTALTLRAEDKARWPDNPFLKDEFAPVHDEVTADNLKVIGVIPKELDGMFVRNGPNPQFPPKKNYHWFDGDGMLHGVRLRDGKASYRNRYVRTAKFHAERKAGTALGGSLLDKPDFAAPNFPMNTANTALVWHAGKLLALWEAGPPHAIKLPDLDTAGPHDFGGKLRSAFTAHPKVDPRTGEMIFFGYNLLQPRITFGIVSAKGEITRSQTFAIRRPVMMHDFAVSEKYAVFMDLPATFDLGRALKGGPAIDFEPTHGARFGLLPRAGGDVKWFEAPPCYVFHTLNAYDDGDDVVLLACRYERLPEIFPADGKFDLKKMKPAHLHRWRFNTRTGKAAEEQVDDAVTDFPRVNEALAGRPTRYGYAAHAEVLNLTGLIKYDLRNGTSERHDHGKGCGGGEGVFVPRPGGTAEDDGWLMTYVHDSGANRSELRVVDARAMKVEPVARVLLPQRVPYGFHGAWVEGSKIS